MLSLNLFTAVMETINYFHKVTEHKTFLGFVGVGIVLSLWWRDVIREATFLGFHTKVVQKSIKFGFALFILSEVMFFFGFFWAFFHSSLSPSIWIGCQWPPVGIDPPNPWGFGLLNTVLLLGSGVTLTVAHLELCDRNNDVCGLWNLFTLGLGFYFILTQYREYRKLRFTIADSIYGSCFYMLTGCHGVHVIVGSIFLIVCTYRVFAFHFSYSHHVGYECAIWYWHFVDVVWVVLYFVVYVWGS